MQRNLSLDILRILACLGVITIHTAGSPIVHNMVEQGTMWYNECLIMDALVRWSVPVFAMLTGFFMLNPNRELSIKQLLSKYVLRLFVALCVWSAFYAIALHKSFYPLGSQEGHFWYVGMCIGLYLALPIMRLIVQNKAMLAYFCWTWFFIKIYQFIGNFYILPIDMRDVLFVDYVGYALWGAYCKEILPKINKWLLCAIAGGGASCNSLRGDYNTKRRYGILFVHIAQCNRVINYPVLSFFHFQNSVFYKSLANYSRYLQLHFWHLPYSFVDSSSGVFPCSSLCRAANHTDDYLCGNGFHWRFCDNIFIKENSFYQ